VPDAGIPIEVVEAARETVRNYKTGSRASGRLWELSGGIARCALCGRAMRPRPVKSQLKSGSTSVFNYYRCSMAYGYSGRCEHTQTYRAEGLEARVSCSLCSETPSGCELRSISSSRRSARFTGATREGLRGRRPPFPGVHRGRSRRGRAASIQVRAAAVELVARSG